MNDLRGAFRVLQVVSTNVTAQTATTTSTSFVDITDLSVSITPSATSSKILVMVNMNVGPNGGADDTWYNINRGSTAIAQGVGGTNNASMSYRFQYEGATFQLYQIVNLAGMVLDSPATTSATTYKMQWRTRVGAIYLNRRSDNNIGVSSTITVMEISA
jgi:hypothetical protein